MTDENVNRDDCPPHMLTVLGPGLVLCEKHRQLVVDVDKVMDIAGLDDLDPAEWDDVALATYRAVDTVRALPIPCTVVLCRGGEERAYQVDVRFSTKGESHGEG